MAKIFNIDNPANPIRFVLPKANDQTKYFYKHFDDDLSSVLIPEFQTKVCYFQKFTFADNPIVQFFSDYTGHVIKLFDENGIEVRSYTVTELTIDILAQTFKCYECELNFLGLSEGVYQLRSYYTNEVPAIVTYFSEPIYLKEIHENTILVEYANSENNFDLVLTKGWVGKLRIEGAILNFKPASDDVVYNDEKRNTTTLYSQPYRQFKLWLGSSEGLPDWIIDKINRCFSFDNLQLDGEYYAKIEGSKFEEQRVDLYPFSGQSIDIMPVENSFNNKVSIDDLLSTQDDMIQYIKALQYKANSADISIPLIFKKGVKLLSIEITKRGNDFDLRVKTSTTGSQDDIDNTYSIQGLTTTLSIQQLFDNDKIIELTGLTGIDCDIRLVYFDFNAKKINDSSSYRSIPKGMIAEFHSIDPADYNINFNFATGLGREDTDFAEFAICDGRNGTPNKGARFTIGFLQDDLTFGEIGLNGGAITHTLTESEMPRHNHRTIDPSFNVIGRLLTGGRYVKNKGGSEVGVGSAVQEFTTGFTGGGLPHSILNPYIVGLFIKKIV